MTPPARRVLVTGAGSGVGRAVALALAARGARVALLGRREEWLHETARRIAGAGTLVVPADVTDEMALATVITTVGEQFGALDGLVNAAGVAHFASIESTDRATWAHVLDTNLTGPFLVLRAALPWLRRGDRAAVVNVASTLGLVGLAQASAYSAAKGGLVNWTRAVAVELASQGVRVNAVAPGVIDTPMLDTPRGDPAELAAHRARLAATHPLGRIARAEEIAAMIVTLLDPDSSFITGSIVVVDGGQTAGFRE